MAKHKQSGSSANLSTRSSKRRALIAVALSLLGTLAGCTRAKPPSTPLHLAHTTTTLRLPGIGPCGGDPNEAVTIDPLRPLAVLVHGCHSTQEDFATLAEILSIHEQQTVCFRYDDRERVSTSAAQLRSALEQLSQQLVERNVVVLGHSQGGLVARAAVTTSQEDGPMKLPAGRYRLVTVSAPFGGIRAAAHCGSVPYHLASLGVTIAVCRGISGAKWNEIHPNAAMVTSPAPLDPAIGEHLKIVTDERESCRRYSPDGRHCMQDDFVFSVAEQHNARIERDPRVVETPIAAGHVEVVGARHEPRKLLETLQQHGMMRETSPEQRIVLERMIATHGW